MYVNDRALWVLYNRTTSALWYNGEYVVNIFYDVNRCQTTKFRCIILKWALLWNFIKLGKCGRYSMQNADALERRYFDSMQPMLPFNKLTRDFFQSKLLVKFYFVKIKIRLLACWYN